MLHPRFESVDENLGDKREATVLSYICKKQIAGIEPTAFDLSINALTM